MKFDPILPPERRAAMRAEGFWPDRLITDYLDDAAEQRPDHVAVSDA
nr:hypothetical protein [Gammaproteobacteria bacterium]